MHISPLLLADKQSHNMWQKQETNIYYPTCAPSSKGKQMEFYIDFQNTIKI